MENLKPCPFCGGEPRIYKEPFTKYFGEDVKHIVCSTDYCAVLGPFKTEQEAIEAWNTRAERKCINCQNYKYMNLGRERYCDMWRIKSPVVFDDFSCGWWKPISPE